MSDTEKHAKDAVPKMNLGPHPVEIWCGNPRDMREEDLKFFGLKDENEAN